MQRRRELPIALNVLVEIARHRRVEVAVAMRLVDRLAHVVEDGAVVDATAVFVQRVDDGAVARHLGQRKQRVDPVVARRVRAHLLLHVQLVDLRRLEPREAVVALVHGLEAIHLEHVAEALVDEQPADRKARVVADVPQVARVAAVDHSLHRELHAQLVQRLLMVDGERVVHVEAEPVDLGQVQVPVHEHPFPRLDAHAHRGRRGRRRDAGEGQEQLLGQSRRGECVPGRAFGGCQSGGRRARRGRRGESVHRVPQVGGQGVVHVS